MAIRSLRNRTRPDNLANQGRATRSFARRLYLAALLSGGAWIALQVFGPVVLMDADGLVLQDREVVGASFIAHVVSVTVRPGDHVEKGQQMAMVVSTQMLDLLSNLASRRAQTESRLEQIETRLAAIRSTLPAADQRAKDDEVALATIERAFVAGLTTAPRRAQASEERYQAAREAAGLRGEAKGLTIENATLEGELTRIGAALDQAKTAYRDGAILAPCDGTIGPIVAAPGTVLNPGQQVAEVFHGNRYVVAYLPTNRIYSLRSGDDVVVTDGTSRQPGRIDRIAELADAIPREFQSNFGTIERQQVVRVAVDDISTFPLLSKIKVMRTYAPSNLIAAARDYIVINLTHAGEHWPVQSSLAAKESAQVEKRE